MAGVRIKAGIKIPGPVAHPKGLSMMAHVRPPRIKPVKTRLYAKPLASEDPTKFGDSGFGNTGRTGES